MLPFTIGSGTVQQLWFGLGHTPLACLLQIMQHHRGSSAISAIQVLKQVRYLDLMGDVQIGRWFVGLQDSHRRTSANTIGKSPAMGLWSTSATSVI